MIGRPRGRLDMRGKARRVCAKDLPEYFRCIGRRVRDARVERDVSLHELAAAIGSQPHHVATLERGEIRSRTGRMYGPTTGLIVRIAIALDMQPRELMP